MTLQRKNQGFTIVELLIVIVVIGILALLVVTTFTGIQQRARNTERQTDIKAIHSHLESYHAQEGRYPSLDELNDATFRSNNTRGLDDDVWQDPRGTSGTLASSPGVDVYSYEVTSIDGDPCDNAEGPGGVECQRYVLTATQEGADPFTKESLAN